MNYNSSQSTFYIEQSGERNNAASLYLAERKIIKKLNNEEWLSDKKFYKCQNTLNKVDSINVFDYYLTIKNTHELVDVILNTNKLLSEVRTVGDGFLIIDNYKIKT